ncbi:plasmid mobilization relaxosome protein MobC, partial [Escherichia coli]|nr:plasmid mobilization relaxosome protein MobC [Salmonella enterica subsp. enterica serovar Schwarzengrund]EFO1969155.1 plasmid mobilization relaxosome protein MobC [Escherichia coli]
MPPCKGDYCSWGVMIPMKRER